MDLDNGFDCNTTERGFLDSLMHLSRRLCGPAPFQESSALQLQNCMREYVGGHKPEGMRRIFALKTIENILERLFYSPGLASIETDDSAWKTILTAITLTPVDEEAHTGAMIVLLGVRKVPRRNNRWEYEWTFSESARSTSSELRDLVVARLANDMAEAMQNREAATLPFSSLEDIRPKL